MPLKNQILWRNYINFLHKDDFDKMNFSDDEKMYIQQQIDAFRSIIPKRKNPGGHGKLQPSKEAQFIKEECIKRMDQILDYRIKDTVQRVANTIIQNWQFGCSIVIGLNLKRNQKNDLPKFIKQIGEFQYYSQKIKTMNVQNISKQDVRDIALQIQIRQDQLRQNILSKDDQIFKGKEGQQVDLEKHLIIYVPKRVTNLSQSNIHVFQNNVIKGSYVVILPTFQTLKLVDGQGMLYQNQKYFFEAYNSKQLFIQFFYRCIVSRNIMAYLPKQVLGLIRMYDYYPISYQQGCNMMIYACQVFTAKCQQKGKTKKPVQMKDLIRLFNKTWKYYWDSQTQCMKYNYQKLSQCILDQNAVYKVNEQKIIYYLKRFSVSDIGVQNLSQKCVYENFQKRFKAKLLADQNLKHLAKVFDDFDNMKMRAQNIKVRRKHGLNRQVGLGFVEKNFKSDKQYFQDKITRLFKIATAQVRSQAQYVDWKQINLFQSMRPQIVKDTFDGIMQEHDFRDVFNAIRSFSSLPMVRLIQTFKKMPIGRLIYILRCLELKGLIQLNKNTIKPSLITNYYEKASYHMTSE